MFSLKAATMYDICRTKVDYHALWSNVQVLGALEPADDEYGEIVLALTDMAGMYPARDPEPSQWSALGFVEEVAPQWNEIRAPYLSVPKTCFVMMLRLSERQLTAETINDAVAKRVAVLEDREQRSAYRKEYAEIKEDVIAQLLPLAFIRSKHIPVIFTDKRVIVGTASAKTAEHAMALIRSAQQTAPVRLTLDNAVMSSSYLGGVMTNRLNGLITENKQWDFAFGDAYKFTGDGGKVSLTGEPAVSAMVENTLDDGYEVSQARLFFPNPALLHVESYALVLNLSTKPVITGMKWEDAANWIDTSSDDPGHEFKSTMAIVVTLLDQMVQILKINVCDMYKLEQEFIDIEDADVTGILNTRRAITGIGAPVITVKDVELEDDPYGGL